MTQLVSSLIIYFVGDLVAQSIASPAISVEQAEEGQSNEVGKG